MDAESLWASNPSESKWTNTSLDLRWTWQSYYAPLILHCLQYNIILVLLPPHSSHLLQPLDVGVFGPLKKILSKYLSKLLSTGVHRLEKYEWAMHYVKARPEALSVNNVKGGWRGAGLIPFNRTRIIRSLPDVDISPVSELQSINRQIYSVHIWQWSHHLMKKLYAS
jgi:DDE superfamily endonuclease.